jgi:hypothetical protein
MYIGFNYKTSSTYSAEHQKRGREIGNNQKAIINKVLVDFAKENKSLDGNAIQNNWFPPIKADVFISYSRLDEDKAFGLAGMLDEHFGLTAFVDSNVWGYADDLLKIIDDKYTKITGSESYSYSHRNLSTSHVHMMLASALAMVMDKTECLIFLNPTTILPKETIDTTKSPWIYYEIGISALLEKHQPSRFVNEAIKAFSGLDIEYTLNTKHLIDLKDSNLDEWKKKFNKNNFPQKNHALDVLYNIMNDKKDSKQFIQK